MIDLGPHAVFIIWAYLGAAAVAGLIFWTLFDARRTAISLAALEARNIRRAAK